MTKVEKMLIPVVLIAAGAMCTLWIKEQQTSKKLAMELKQTEIEFEEADALRRGLSKANQELQTRISQVEKAAMQIKAAPLPIMEDIEEPLDDVVLFTSDMAERSRPEDPQANTILSPEELAEQKQQEEERAQRDAERQQRRQEFATRVQTDLQNRRQFFSQINTEGLSAEYVEAHAQLLAALDNSQILMEKMSDPDLSRDERRELGREMWEQSRGMGDLMEMQRDVLLSDYAELSLGLSADKTQEFMNYMETVTEMTSGSPMRGGGNGGRGGRGR